MLVRLDEQAAPAGWTAQQLVLVARRRLAAECERLPSPEVRDAVVALDRAASVMTERISAPSDGNWGVAFRQGGIPSPYPWCVAGHSGFDIPLCPDPESRDEGVTSEQLLIALDQCCTTPPEHSPTGQTFGRRAATSPRRSPPRCAGSPPSTPDLILARAAAAVMSIVIRIEIIFR
jgi:hypothetical protein